ncbi:hypothetical protein KIPB_008338, partial [Kipferlia bialata]
CVFASASDRVVDGYKDVPWTKLSRTIMRHRVGKAKASPETKPRLHPVRKPCLVTTGGVGDTPQVGEKEQVWDSFVQQYCTDMEGTFDTRYIAEWHDRDVVPVSMTDPGKTEETVGRQAKGGAQRFRDGGVFRTARSLWLTGVLLAMHNALALDQVEVDGVLVVTGTSDLEGLVMPILSKTIRSDS